MVCGLSPVIGFGFSLYPMTDRFVDRNQGGAATVVKNATI